MWVPRYAMSPDTVRGEWMGMSFFISRHDAATIVGHTGSQAGFRAFYYWNPATRTAVIAAFNTSNEVAASQSGAGFRGVRDAAWVLLK